MSKYNTCRLLNALGGQFISRNFGVYYFRNEYVGSVITIKHSNMSRLYCLSFYTGKKNTFYSANNRWFEACYALGHLSMFYPREGVVGIPCGLDQLKTIPHGNLTEQFETGTGLRIP